VILGRLKLHRNFHHVDGHYPYSPDLNPIEQVFAKLKSILRTAAARSVHALWNAIGTSLQRFAPTECANYLANSGYPRSA
jgi:transposase